MIHTIHIFSKHPEIVILVVLVIIVITVTKVIMALMLKVVIKDQCVFKKWPLDSHRALDTKPRTTF